MKNRLFTGMTILFISVFSTITQAQQYHTANVGTLVTNMNANDQLAYGTYDLQTGNGANNINFPLPQQYGNLINFSSASFLTQFVTTHEAYPTFFLRVLYKGGSFTSWNKIVLERDGKVGVGTNTPEGKLQVISTPQAPTGNILTLGPGTAANLRLGYNTDYTWIQSGSQVPLYINKLGNNTVLNADAGSVGIGTTIVPADYKLAVAGKVIADELKIKPHASGWPDYVFSKNYTLPSLEEVENFIQTNNHLPGVPTAKEVQKEGLEVGANQAILLKKIEELTLYIIEQDKKQKQTEQTLTEIQKTNAKLVSEIQLLKKH